MTNPLELFEVFLDPERWDATARDRLRSEVRKAAPLQEVAGDLVTHESPTIFGGPLHIAGNLEIENSFLVLGDLDVGRAVWSDRAKKLAGPPVLAIVAGCLRCRGLFLSETDCLFVARTIEASEVTFVPTGSRVVSSESIYTRSCGRVSPAIKVLQPGRRPPIRFWPRIPGEPEEDQNRFIEDVLIEEWSHLSGPSYELAEGPCRDRIRAGQSIFKVLDVERARYESRDVSQILIVDELRPTDDRCDQVTLRSRGPIIRAGNRLAVQGAPETIFIIREVIMDYSRAGLLPDEYIAHVTLERVSGRGGIRKHDLLVVR